MDIKDLAHYLGIGKSKIYSLIRQRKIPASRIGPLSLAQIRYRDGEAFDPVFQATDVAGVSSDQDADPASNSSVHSPNPPAGPLRAS